MEILRIERKWSKRGSVQRILTQASLILCLFSKEPLGRQLGPIHLGLFFMS